MTRLPMRRANFARSAQIPTIAPPNPKWQRAFSGTSSPLRTFSKSSAPPSTRISMREISWASSKGRASWCSPTMASTSVIRALSEHPFAVSLGRRMTSEWSHDVFALPMLRTRRAISDSFRPTTPRTCSGASIFSWPPWIRRMFLCAPLLEAGVDFLHYFQLVRSSSASATCAVGTFFLSLQCKASRSENKVRGSPWRCWACCQGAQGSYMEIHLS